MTLDLVVYIVVLMALAALSGATGFLLRWHYRYTAILAAIVSLVWFAVWRLIR